MIIFGIVKLGSWQNFTGNCAKSSRRKLLCKDREARRSSLCLPRTIGIDARAILRAAIIALAHALSRIMTLPKDLQQGLISHNRRVKYHPHHLIMPSFAGADLFISRIGRIASRIAHHGHPDPLNPPKHPLHTPKASHAEHRLLQPRIQRSL